jgi:hypothetical protein
VVELVSVKGVPNHIVPVIIRYPCEPAEQCEVGVLHSGGDIPSIPLPSVARDHLSITSSSVSTERLFSQAGDMIANKRKPHMTKDSRSWRSCGISMEGLGWSPVEKLYWSIWTAGTVLNLVIERKKVGPNGWREKRMKMKMNDYRRKRETLYTPATWPRRRCRRRLYCLDIARDVTTSLIMSRRRLTCLAAA